MLIYEFDIKQNATKHGSVRNKMKIDDSNCFANWRNGQTPGQNFQD